MPRPIAMPTNTYIIYHSVFIFDDSVQWLFRIYRKNFLPCTLQMSRTNKIINRMFLKNTKCKIQNTIRLFTRCFWKSNNSICSIHNTCKHFTQFHMFHFNCMIYDISIIQLTVLQDAKYKNKIREIKNTEYRNKKMQ